MKRPRISGLPTGPMSRTELPIDILSLRVFITPVWFTYHTARRRSLSLGRMFSMTLSALPFLGAFLRGIWMMLNARWAV